MEVTYTAVKQVNPHIQILGGALANTFGYVAVFQGCAVVATLWLIGWLRRRAAA